jgi:hypothetical protein
VPAVKLVVDGRLAGRARTGDAPLPAALSRRGESTGKFFVDRQNNFVTKCVEMKNRRFYLLNMKILYNR